MSIIKLMDPKLANMIAAGEVVDRPASIIKELVENSIDANASIITIEVKEMGMSFISVTDNGSGMDFLDAHLAFDRHATSKIKDESDLSSIKTLGFRGEALAAISSVAKVTLMTRQKDSDGFYVTYHGGKFINDGTASISLGTVVTVTDLFYNTPARFKYIKSEVLEKMEIINIFDRLALANPSIRMKLIIDDKEIKHTFGNNDFYSLIDQIYGSRMTKDMTVFSKEVQKTKITGYLLSKDITRSRKKDISIFVNKRYIKNYKLINAVVEGYHSFLMTNKYPIALIHLELDPSLLDVNVHPQKYEVKFVNESILAYYIENFIKEALLNKVHHIPENLNQIKKFDKETFETIQMTFDEPKNEYKTNTFDLTENINLVKIPDFEYVGTFSGTYLLFQNEQGLYLVDQHAAQERIRYEYYYEKLANPKKDKKELIISYQPNITKQDITVLKNNIKLLNSYGFEFNDSQELTHIPLWLKDDEIDKAIESIVTMLIENQEISLIKLRDHLAKDISCKGSIKANQSLNKNEIDQLIKDFKKTNNPYTCPHGRPTIIKLSHHDIEKLFKRVL